METINQEEAKMITTKTLTLMEAQLLELALNYNERETQLSDNYTNASVQDAHYIAGGKHEGAGLIGSLVKKGFVVEPDPRDEDDGLWLTEAGVHAIFDHLEGVAA